MEFRSAYTYDDAESDRHGFKTVGESLAKQEFKDECDINVIMKRYAEFGVVPPPSASTPMYGDFSDVGDLLEAQRRVQQAEEDFASLPSRIRDRFSNSPAQFLDFILDPSNRDEAIELGLIAKPVVNSVAPEVSKTAPPPPAAGT